MSDSPSGWLRSLAAEATPGGQWKYVYAPDDSYGNEIVMVKDERGALIQYAEWCYGPHIEKNISRLIALAPDLAVLCADAIDALTELLESDGHRAGRQLQARRQAKDALARVAALQPEREEERRD